MIPYEFLLPYDEDENSKYVEVDAEFPYFSLVLKNNIYEMIEITEDQIDMGDDIKEVKTYMISKFLRNNGYTVFTSGRKSDVLKHIAHAHNIYRKQEKGMDFIKEVLEDFPEYNL